MIVVSRLLAVCCVALLVTGAAGAIAVAPKAARQAPSAVPTATSTVPPVSIAPTASTEPTAPAGPASSSATLSSGLIQPADMGGYYRPSTSALNGLLDANPCLAALQPSPAQSGRAAEGLVTGDRDEVPQIVEIVASYTGRAPTSVYDSTVAAINACSHFGFQFDGSAVSGTLAPEPLATSADAGTAWQVPFAYQGQPCELQMALVRQGQNVLFLGWADTAAPSPAIMGGFASTVTAAIGEEA